MVENPDNTESPLADTSPVEAQVETVEVTVEDQLREELKNLRTEHQAIKEELKAIKENPMAPLLDVKPLTKEYDFKSLIELYDGDEMNCFGAILGQLELDLKQRGVSMGVNQARTTDGEGRESSAGVSKKGSVEFASIKDVLHLPPVLLDELDKRKLIKIVGGNTLWVGMDELISKKSNANTSGSWESF